MGKIKEQRFRVHKNIIKKVDLIKNSVLDNVEKATEEESLLLPPIINENPFSGIAIDINKISKPSSNFDTQSISGKSHREVKKAEQNLPKKEKQKRRHERFLEKLEIMYAKNKKKKPKKKKNIDLEPLLVSLPTEPAKPQKQKVPIARQSMKIKQRLRHDKKDIKHFKKVLNDSVFRKNPALVIKEFLQQKIAEKRPDLQPNEET